MSVCVCVFVPHVHTFVGWFNNQTSSTRRWGGTHVYPGVEQRELGAVLSPIVRSFMLWAQKVYKSLCSDYKWFDTVIKHKKKTIAWPQKIEIEDEDHISKKIEFACEMLLSKGVDECQAGDIADNAIEMASFCKLVAVGAAHHDVTTLMKSKSTESRVANKKIISLKKLMHATEDAIDKATNAPEKIIAGALESGEREFCATKLQELYKSLLLDMGSLVIEASKFAEQEELKLDAFWGKMVRLSTLMAFFKLSTPSRERS